MCATIGGMRSSPGGNLMCAITGSTRSSRGGNLMSTNGGTRSNRGGLVSANGAMRSSNIERKKEVVQFYDFQYYNSKKIRSIRFCNIEF
jgi:hypothetical protein